MSSNYPTAVHRPAGARHRPRWRSACTLICALTACCATAPSVLSDLLPASLVQWGYHAHQWLRLIRLECQSIRARCLTAPRASLPHTRCGFLSGCNEVVSNLLFGRAECRDCLPHPNLKRVRIKHMKLNSTPCLRNGGSIPARRARAKASAHCLKMRSSPASHL